MSADSASADHGVPSLAPVYRFMARLVIRPLDAPALEVLRQPEARAILVRCDPGVDEVLGPLTPERQQVVDEAYAAAFLLPSGAPPRASAWLGDGSDDKLDAFTAAVVAQMQRLGLERVYSEDAGRLPLDHLGLLLEVAAVGLERGHTSAPPWIEAHLTRWAPRWGQALATCSTHPLYRALGVLSASVFTD